MKHVPVNDFYVCILTEIPLQRQLRLSDAKQVEEKAARIKDWVTNKLRDLEQQNEHLKAQNERANAQMEILRQKLEQLQVSRDKTQEFKKRTGMAEEEGKPPAKTVVEVSKEAQRCVHTHTRLAYQMSWRDLVPSLSILLSS